MRLAGKVAIVTGGTSGIGKACVSKFAAEGAAVVAASNEDCGPKVIDEMQFAGDRACFVHLDVTSEEGWIDFARWAERTHRGVDILVNNAGIELVKRLLETTLEEWEHVMAVNATGPFLAMKHIIPLMIGRGGGSVINMSSEAGLVGAGGWTAYAASKGAVRLMTKDAAVEFAEYGIRVNSVHPGIVQTPMMDRVDAVFDAGLGVVDGLTPSAVPPIPPILLGRRATPEDVANMVLFLASDESSYCTGSEFVVDGGDTCH